MNPALMAVSSTNQKGKQPKDDGKPLIPGLPATAVTKKKKKKPAKGESEVKEVTSKLAGFTIQEPTFGEVKAEPSVSKPTSCTTQNSADPTSTTDPAKRLKNLKKRLRDIEGLEAKVKSGELKNPDKDQLEKIKRKPDVLKEIKELEKMVK